MAVPVAYDKAREAQFPAQLVVEKFAVAMHLLAIDARKTGHHGLHVSSYCWWISGAMQGPYFIQRTLGIALVDTVFGAAVADKMLGGCDDLFALQETGTTGFALHPPDNCAGVRRNDHRIFRVAFIGPPPAIILRHCQGRCEIPIEAGGAYFLCCNSRDAPEQIRVPGSAQPDIVREDHRTLDIAVAMDCVRAPEQGDSHAPIGNVGRCGPEIIGQRDPLLNRGHLSSARGAVAPIQNRPEIIALRLLGRHCRDVGLENLSDFFLERHFFEQLLGP